MEHATGRPDSTHPRIRGLLDSMTLEEKIGQLTLVNGAEGAVPEDLRREVAAGRVGAVLNEVDPATVQELQRIARQESRLGLPLLIGRDVIHGFRTIFPIPLGQAATWNPALVEECARHSAMEAAAHGITWAFAPMLDIGRDARWGRIAETLGEDPLLIATLGTAMVNGLQNGPLQGATGIAACAKHFAGYGASEGGRDYSTCSIPEIDLRQTHLPPFRAALEAGVATVMTSFSDLNGVPASANAFLLRQVLREEWGFEGFVVSDWESVSQLVNHGIVEGPREAAREAALAGVDMEMASTTFREHLPSLLAAGEVDLARLDAMAGAVLALKLRLGLLDGRADRPLPPAPDLAAALDCAYRAALHSVVLLRNEHRRLPLDRASIRRAAVIGPLADEPVEQLGTWIFDADATRSVTPLQALRAWQSDTFRVSHARGLETSRDRSTAGFGEAVEMARAADVALLFLGEEAILSGEAHCRADIRLPGAQQELLRQVAATGTPTVLVLLTGRPLALQEVIDLPEAVLCAWHPGSLAGPALRDLLFGVETPSGRLPAGFPRMTGQIPVHYSRRNTGRPPDPATFVHLDDLPRGATQHGVGNTAHHLDAGWTPLFPFGHGLSYTTFDYRNLRLEDAQPGRDGTLVASVDLCNTGDRAADEVLQLYVQDLVGSVARPVKELKAFRREHLAAGECRTVTFRLPVRDLAFVDRTLHWTVEPGRFRLWIAGSSDGGEPIGFEVR